MRRILPLVFGLAAAPASLPAQDEAALSQRTMDALTHVVAHEIGHAVLREFDLPILGPEEAIVDDFATVYVHLLFPERAGEIVTARSEQNLADGEEASPFSEYVDDDQRAGRAVCLLHGLDPKRHQELPDRFGMNDEEAATCRDLGPEVGRGWRRLIDAHRMPKGARVTEVRLAVDDDVPLSLLIGDSELGDASRIMLSGIDWHSLITLSVEACDGASRWSRNGRQITICDAYVERFERQLGG